MNEDSRIEGASVAKLRFTSSVLGDSGYSCREKATRAMVSNAPIVSGVTAETRKRLKCRLTTTSRRTIRSLGAEVLRQALPLSATTQER